MTARKRRSQLLRKARFEAFEEKLALSAQPVADFYLTSEVEQRVEMHFGQLEQHIEEINNLDSDITSRISHHASDVSPHLGDVHDGTGVNYVYNTYGFTGAGQTVAVIDSGIAWDHVALGGGFGTGQRIVGGYDFAENDSDPYDDGPDGFHGTHVAGIIGSDNSTYRGVAPEADIVALRVFDDNGAGYFSWVESALQWVHDNRNAFANPITTVNMSLGTSWNSDSIPNWTTIEDELAQLEQDGIFIAVSAGNSFADYNTPGLSYPAASPYVVPVASVTNAGSFSSFSQRHDRAIAAPGSSITSTVPDYVFGADGNPNDFGTASGTSMASPYVAGASVLIRQAMEFVGVQNITQDTIYDHIRDTADILYDAATDANYHRLNVQSALDALIPNDDFGNDSQNANNLDVLSNETNIAGTIETTSDSDFFQFTADFTGSVTVSLDTTYGQTPTLAMLNGSPANQSNELQIDVTEGDTYTFSVSANGGVSQYNLAFDIVGTFAPIDIGSVNFLNLTNQQITGNMWLQLEATTTGFLTVEAFHASSASSIDLDIFDENLQQIGGSSNASTQRSDVATTSGQSYYVRVSGDISNVDLRLANLIEASNNTLVIHGTANDDVISIDLNDNSVSVNDVAYSANILQPTTNTITVNTSAGSDSLQLTGSTSNELLTLASDGLLFEGQSMTVTAGTMETIEVSGGGGIDSANLSDTDGNDSFVGGNSTASLSGLDYQFRINNFSQIHVSGSNGGHDTAQVHDTSLNDLFTATSATAILTSATTSLEVAAFEEVTALAMNGGYDIARLYDTAGNETFIANAITTTLSGSGFSNSTNGFEHVYGYATRGGFDTAELSDSVGDDLFMGTNRSAWMVGSGLYRHAEQFDQVTVTSQNGGNDVAKLYDTPGTDQFTANDSSATLSGSGYSNSVSHFGQVFAYATAGGYDFARLYDSIGNDTYVATPTSAVLSGNGFYNYAEGFDQAYGYSTRGGYDIARMYDSMGNDNYVATPRSAYLTGSGFYNHAEQFEQAYGYSTRGGHDIARLYDSLGNDDFVARPRSAYLTGSGFYNHAEQFEQAYGYGTRGGHDVAQMYDSSGNDNYVATPQSASLFGHGFYNHAQQFDETRAYSTFGGDDTATFVDSVEDDTFVSTLVSASLQGNNFRNYAEHFRQVFASATFGTDTASISDVASSETLHGRGDLMSVNQPSVDNSERLQLQGFAYVSARVSSSASIDIELIDYVFEQFGE